MPYPATVFQVMIASPGDVAEEREKARELIHQWNANHSREKGIVLLPADWTTHSSPEMGDRPQEIINRQVLEDSDLLVGIFGTRLGTPTGEAQSGTVEEIEKHMTAGKPAMLYFSTANEGRLDEESLRQFQALTEFRESLEKSQQGLIWRFSSLQDFENQFRDHLYQKVTNHSYFKEFGGLSSFASNLLKTASASSEGWIGLWEHEGTFKVLVHGGTKFFITDRANEASRVKEDINKLEKLGLILAEEDKENSYLLTQKGYKYADQLPE